MQVIKGRYEAQGDKHETDEFLKPIIVDPEGRVKGVSSSTESVVKCCMGEKLIIYRFSQA